MYLLEQLPRRVASTSWVDNNFAGQMGAEAFRHY